MAHTPRTLLIDGDLFLYRITSAAEEETHWGGDNWTLHSDAQACRETWDSFVEMFREILGAQKTLVAFSDPEGNYFRKDLADTYKAKRSARKPVAFAAVREYIQSTYDTVCHEKLEGDDVLGLYADEMNAVIVSDDKDMLTVPGTLYRAGQMFRVTPEAADYAWMQQTLTGDSTDGYPGCPGIGPVKASKILDSRLDFEELWGAVVAAFEKAGKTEEDAITQARLARILRAGEYDEGTGEITLWSPQGQTA